MRHRRARLRGSRAALRVALALAACGACAGARPAPGARGGVVAPSELPADHQALWTAWRERDPAWPELRAAALADARRRRFLIENLAAELVAAYVSGDLSAGHTASSGRYERARAELLVIGAPAAPVVAELLAIGDGAAAFACAELLGALGEGALESVAGLLARPEARARERAALVLADLPHAGPGEERVRAALARLASADPEWNVRAAAVRAVAARGARDPEVGPALAILLAALRDADPSVAREAASGLARLGDRAAVPALINRLERCEREADLGARDACLGALEVLTGTRGPRRPAEWRVWWREHGTRSAPRGG